MLNYGGFWIESKEGNNQFAYEAKKDTKIWVAELIDAPWKTAQLGTKPVFAEKNKSGELASFIGLQHFLFFQREGVPIYLFDNHNHALAFWYRELFKGKIKKGISLIHLDQHSDMGDNPHHIQEENWENICHFTNYSCHVGNFIQPALKSGLIGSVQQIRSEYGLLHSRIPLEDYLLDIDLDFWEEKMGIEQQETCFQQTRNLIRNAKAVSIATSPYFLDQHKALELIDQIFEEE